MQFQFIRPYHLHSQLTTAQTYTLGRMHAYPTQMTNKPYPNLFIYRRTWWYMKYVAAEKSCVFHLLHRDFALEWNFSCELSERDAHPNQILFFLIKFRALIEIHGERAATRTNGSAAYSPARRTSLASHSTSGKGNTLHGLMCPAHTLEAEGADKRANGGHSRILCTYRRACRCRMEQPFYPLVRGWWCKIQIPFWTEQRHKSEQRFNRQYTHADEQKRIETRATVASHLQICAQANRHVIELGPTKCKQTM